MEWRDPGSIGVMGGKRTRGRRSRREQKEEKVRSEKLRLEEVLRGERRAPGKELGEEEGEAEDWSLGCSQSAKITRGMHP